MVYTSFVPLIHLLQPQVLECRHFLVLHVEVLLEMILLSFLKIIPLTFQNLPALSFLLLLDFLLYNLQKIFLFLYFLIKQKFHQAKYSWHTYNSLNVVLYKNYPITQHFLIYFHKQKLTNKSLLPLPVQLSPLCFLNLANFVYFLKGQDFSFY